MWPLLRSRLKRDVLEDARVWVDIDESGPGTLERILHDAWQGRPGSPRLAVESSPGRVQSSGPGVPVPIPVADPLVGRAPRLPLTIVRTF